MTYIELKEKNLKGDNQMSKINKDMTIAEILGVDRMGIAPILMQNGLHCLACPVSTQETLEEACVVHGIELESILGEINEYLEK